jgi:hypothetical protein
MKTNNQYTVQLQRKLTFYPRNITDVNFQKENKVLIHAPIYSQQQKINCEFCAK